MNLYIILKEYLKKEALSFNKIDYKKMFFLSLVLLGNIIYLFLLGMGYFKTIHNISLRTINTFYSIISCFLFIYILKDDLYNTFKFKTNKGGIKNTFLFANITFICSSILYYFYNNFMLLVHPTLGGDVQHIHNITKIDWFNYFTLIGRYVFSILNEELILLSVFLIIISLFKTNTIKNIIIGLIGTIFFFGGLHYINWNIATVPAVIISKLPACVLFIFIKDIKPFYLAHLFNNAFVALLTVNGINNAIRTGIYWTFLLPLIIYLIYNTLENKFISKN